MTRFWLFGMLVVAGCLPDDARPEPGELFVTAVGSQATREGFETDDGWQVTFDTLAVSLGKVALRDSPYGPCVGYSFTNYTWLRDYTEVASPAKVALVHGVGSCEFFFAASPVDAATRTDGPLDVSSVPAVMEPPAAVITGRGEKEGRVQRFELVVTDPIGLGSCVDTDVNPLTFELSSGEQATLALQVRGERLFDSGGFGETMFEHYVFYDANEDGVLTTEEYTFWEWTWWFGPFGDYAFSPMGLMIAPADFLGCATALP